MVFEWSFLLGLQLPHYDASMSTGSNASAVNHIHAIVLGSRILVPAQAQTTLVHN